MGSTTLMVMEGSTRTMPFWQCVTTEYVKEVQEEEEVAAVVEVARSRVSRSTSARRRIGRLGQTKFASMVHLRVACALLLPLMELLVAAMEVKCATSPIAVEVEVEEVKQRQHQRQRRRQLQQAEIAEEAVRLQQQLMEEAVAVRRAATMATAGPVKPFLVANARGLVVAAAAA